MKFTAHIFALLATTASAAAVPQDLFPRSLNLLEPEAKPSAAAIADFTGDGLADALFAGFTGLLGPISQPSQIVPSLGNGEFGVPVAVTPPISFALHVKAEDFNGDGRLDFVLVKGRGPGASIALYLNEGDLSFREVEAGSIVEEIAELRVADVDGDGMKDVFVSSRGRFNAAGVIVDAGIFVFRFDGMQFDPQPVRATAMPSGNFSALDLTGDGRSDLLFPSTPFPIRWRLSASLVGGGFSSPRTFLGPELEDAIDLEFADLDGDGDLDLVVLRDSTLLQDMLILERNDLGNYQVRGRFDSGITSLTLKIDVHDLNGDGIGDIVYRQFTNPPFSMSARIGVGNFTYGFQTPLFDAVGSLIFALGDLSPSYS